MKLPPYLRLRTSDPGYEAALRDHFQGTYQSSWPFLVRAARSNLIHAAVSTSKLVKQYRVAVSQNQRPAEMKFVLNFNYDMLLAGPLLGTILTVAASLEAFLRSGMRAFMEKDLPKHERSRGTGEDALKALGEFDTLTATAKLDHLANLLLSRRCANSLRDEFGYLMDFRNDCFHADAVLRLRSGGDETTKRGQRRRVPLSKGMPPEYPLLWASNRPLSLTHALRAARTHDAVVRDLLWEPTLRYLRAAFDVPEDGAQSIGLIEQLLPQSCAFNRVDALAKEWDGVVEEGLASVSEEDDRLFLLDLRRKATLRPAT